MTVEHTDGVPGLSLGQRLMIGLVIAPGALMMALEVLLGPLSAPVTDLGTVEAVASWAYVLILVWLGCTALLMAVTGRAPPGLRR